MNLRPLAILALLPAAVVLVLWPVGHGQAHGLLVLTPSIDAAAVSHRGRVWLLASTAPVAPGNVGPVVAFGEPAAAADAVLVPLTGDLTPQVVVDVGLTFRHGKLPPAPAGPFAWPGRGPAGVLWVAGVPHWLLAAVLLAPAGLVALKAARRRHRRRHGRCVACGYDLRTRPPRCPECGAPAEAG